MSFCLSCREKQQENLDRKIVWGYFQPHSRLLAHCFTWNPPTQVEVKLISDLGGSSSCLSLLSGAACRASLALISFPWSWNCGPHHGATYMAEPSSALVPGCHYCMCLCFAFLKVWFTRETSSCVQYCSPLCSVCLPCPPPGEQNCTQPALPLVTPPNEDSCNARKGSVQWIQLQLIWNGFRMMNR